LSSSLRFPKNFIFGVATSAYQIEGATSEGGRTDSIWDTFCRMPGKTHSGHTGDIACDHYHRYAEDVQTIADLGVSSYRFSIAWPRIFPEKGKFNAEGMDFYKRLVDELEKRQLKPAVTMYHWDLPEWLGQMGGWLNRDVSKYFGEYAETLLHHLGVQVDTWITHNEPWCASFLSYGIGEHAPGHTDWREALTAAHHLLLSHGEALQAYRASGLDGNIGITLNLGAVYPASSSPEDVAAARTADGFTNRWFLDPLFRAQYPEDMLEKFEARVGRVDFIRDGDLQHISAPMDFLGVNYYTRSVVKADVTSEFLGVGYVPSSPDSQTDMGWEVHPESLYRLLKRVASEYTDIPLYVTENGAAYADVLEDDGQIHDTARIAYVEGHLAAAERFIEDGGDLRGYYLWSLMDNFEWAYGYSKRFGIVYVDYDTQKRVLKDSAKWYRELATKHRTQLV
jgi:beta-glucosidase